MPYTYTYIYIYIRNAIDIEIYIYIYNPICIDVPDTLCFYEVFDATCRKPYDTWAGCADT